MWMQNTLFFQYNMKAVHEFNFMQSTFWVQFDLTAKKTIKMFDFFHTYAKK